MQISELIKSLKVEPEPRGARIMVLPLLRARKGLIVDTEENREKPESGIVLKVGPGGISAESGRDIPIISQPGQVVWYGKYAGLLTDAESDKGPICVFLMQESEVLMSQPGDFELIVHDDNPMKAHRKGLTCDDCAPAHDLDRLQAIARGELLDGGVIDAEVDEADAPESDPFVKER